MINKILTGVSIGSIFSIAFGIFIDDWVKKLSFVLTLVSCIVLNNVSPITLYFVSNNVLFSVRNDV